MEKGNPKPSGNQGPEHDSEPQATISPVFSETPKKFVNKPIFTLGLLVLIVILMGIIGLIVYQNIQLNKKLGIVTKSAWKGYVCNISEEVSNQINNNSLTSNDPNLGCTVPIFLCKGDICTYPTSIIKCGQSKNVCGFDLDCICR